MQDENTCPVCKDTMMIPRIYECGHTICEICMKDGDRITKKNVLSKFTVPYYKCPLCREKTIVEWYLRPINRVLLNILRKDNDYEHKYIEYKKKNTTKTPDIPSNVNLAALTKKNKILLTYKLYNKILPLLYDAAVNGKSVISIEKPICRDIQIVSDSLSEILFINHNIHKLVATSHECVIELVSSVDSYKSEYINDDYDSDNDSTFTHEEIQETEHTRPTSPPPPPPELRTTSEFLSVNPTRFSSMVLTTRRDMTRMLNVSSPRSSPNSRR